MKEKKKSEKRESKEEKKREKGEFMKYINNKYEKQTKIAIIIMFVLIAIILFAHWVIQSINKFDYNGMKFYKEETGAVTYYKTTVMNFFPTGIATSEGIPIQLKLRNDPRELEDISIDGRIDLVNLNKKVILSLGPEVVNCSDTYITMMDFSRTLTAFGKEVSAGTTDWVYSRENDIPQATCAQAKDKTVIIMQKGEENKITVNKSPFEEITIKDGKQTQTTKYKDCYIIDVANCEIQKGFERFLLSMMENLVVK